MRVKKKRIVRQRQTKAEGEDSWSDRQRTGRETERVREGIGRQQETDGGEREKEREKERKKERGGGEEREGGESGGRRKRDRQTDRQTEGGRERG